MKAVLPLALLIAGASCVLAQPQNQHHAPENSDKPTPSEHRPGPHGLEGWTLDGTIPDHPGEQFPFTLVIARNGRVIRRFPGEGFVWRWKFLADGRQVAYESGALHFVLACVLADIETGKELSRYDCSPELPPDAPDWVKTLEANP